MKRLLFVFLILAACVTPVVPGFCGDNKIVLTSLEWPPYTGAALPRAGMSSEVVRTAFEAMGYTVEIRFFPWKRAVEKAMHDVDVAGYFPEYASAERSKYFLFSDVIGTSPVGFVEPKESPVQWKTMKDLSGYVVGTVQGYVNTEEFDRMVAEGGIRTDASVSDRFNLRKVLAGRVNVAVTDVNVFRYLSQKDGLLRKGRHMLRVNPRLLGINDLYVCFRKGNKGEALLKVFNEGLSRISVKAIQIKYFEAVFPDKN